MGAWGGGYHGAVGIEAMVGDIDVGCMSMHDVIEVWALGVMEFSGLARSRDNGGKPWVGGDVGNPKARGAPPVAFRIDN